MKLSRSIAALFLLFVIPCAHAQKSKPIEKQEIADWYYKTYDCPAEPRMYFYTFELFDFKGDGTQQAIVVAMSCAGGTGGPDVHSVISRNSDGELEEMKIAEVDPKTYDNMFGNSNYNLVVENGLLVANFEDDPDRSKIPHIIRYKWNGKEFAVNSIHKTGIFPTSYDCKKSLSEVENAICHVEELAALDMQLGAAYTALLAKLSPTDRDALKADQRAWLINRDKQCAPYKGWIGCLTDFYQKRIDELKKRATVSSSKDRDQFPRCESH